MSQEGALTAENTSLSPVLQQGFSGGKKKAIHLALCSLIHGFKPRLPAAPPNHSSSPAPSDAQQGLHHHLPLPLVLDQDTALSLMKTPLCVCVSEQDLHQILHDLPKDTSPLFLIILGLCPSSYTPLPPSLIFTPTRIALTTRICPPETAPEQENPLHTPV